MTILTSEVNWRGQLDKCYVIVEVVWVVLSMSDGPICSDNQATRTTYSITSKTTQCDSVTASTATNIYQ